MARIRLSPPAHFPFTTTLPVRITDLNYGGHVGNDTILSLVHEARMQFLQSLGYTEMNMEGVSLIMSDAAIEFRGEVFYGDTIRAFVAAAEFSRAGFELYYRFETGDNKTVALAKTGMVCFNYNQRKVASLPEAAQTRLAARDAV